MSKTIESKYKITYEYTTSSISGYVTAEPEFFGTEAGALKRYADLKYTGVEIGGHRQLKRSSVQLWKNAGWVSVL